MFVTVKCFFILKTFHIINTVFKKKTKIFYAFLQISFIRYNDSCPLTNFLRDDELISHLKNDVLRIYSWVACIFVPLVTQSCRRMKGSNRHEWLVVLRRTFVEHSDCGYLLYPRVVIFYLYALISLG